MCCSSDFQKGLTLTVIGSVLLLKTLNILTVDLCSLIYGGIIIVGLSIMIGAVVNKK